MHFSDSGLFGISIEGSGSHSQDLLSVGLESLSELKQKVSDEELERAKNILKMQILLSMEKHEDRLEEIAKNYLAFGDLTFHQYTAMVDAVTSQQINKVVSKVLEGKPTLLVTGDAINLVPNVTEVQRQLK